MIALQRLFFYCGGSLLNSGSSLLSGSLYASAGAAATGLSLLGLCIGLSLGLDFTRYRFNSKPVNDIETSLGITQTDIDSYEKANRRHLQLTEFNLELFQRVRLVALGLAGNGLHWDLGVYGSLCNHRYIIGGLVPATTGAKSIRSVTRYSHPDATSAYGANFGIVTRFTYDMIGIFVRYRLNGLGKAPAAGEVLLPRLTVGLQLQY